MYTVGKKVVHPMHGAGVIEENFIPHRLYGFPPPKQGYIKKGTNIAAGSAFA